MGPLTRQRDERVRIEGSLLLSVRLRYLTAGITLAGVLAFLALAALHQQAAPVALAGALLIAAHGLFWLVVLRRNRARLRRHGFRW